MGNTYGKFDGNKSRLLSRYTNFRVRIRVSISRWIFELSSGLLVQNMGRIVLRSRHPRDARKVSVTGTGRLRECKNTEFVWELK